MKFSTLIALVGATAAIHLRTKHANVLARKEEPELERGWDKIKDWDEVKQIEKDAEDAVERAEREALAKKRLSKKRLAKSKDVEEDIEHEWNEVKDWKEVRDVEDDLEAIVERAEEEGETLARKKLGMKNKSALAKARDEPELEKAWDEVKNWEEVQDVEDDLEAIAERAEEEGQALAKAKDVEEDIENEWEEVEDWEEVQDLEDDLEAVAERAEEEFEVDALARKEEPELEKGWDKIKNWDEVKKIERDGEAAVERAEEEMALAKRKSLKSALAKRR
jgi:hypothetical protein